VLAGPPELFDDADTSDSEDDDDAWSDDDPDNENMVSIRRIFVLAEKLYDKLLFVQFAIRTNCYP
jgi:hypothetical protein